MAIITERSEMEISLGWAQSYMFWQHSVRRFLAGARASGLTKFDVRVERGSVIKIQAMRPDAVWEPVA